MSAKVIRYTLLTGVALVWGIILYRVVSASGKTPEKNMAQPLSKSNFAAEEKDSFTLLDNYPDPFLPADTVYEAEITTVKDTAVQEIPIDISFIKYTGFISNPKKRIKNAFITINGITCLYKENEVKNDVKVISIKPESISIMYKKRKFTIYIN